MDEQQQGGDIKERSPCKQVESMLTAADGTWNSQHNPCACTVTKAALMLPSLSLLKLLGRESSHAHSHSGLAQSVMCRQLVLAVTQAPNPMSNMLRPYHPECTPSRPIREVKLDWAQLVLG